jgi:predicted  nucleic acid-binding Zn-ribbon protein
MVAIPAEAAPKISNGVACTKSGATTKTSGGTYKCAKNPLVSSTKLTWLSLDCITAANDAIKAQKSAVTTAANFKAQLPVIELGITTETANRLEIQTKLDAATLRLTAAQAKLAAAKTDADKRLLTTAVSSWTSATRAYASKIRNIDLTIKKLEAAKLAGTNKPAELAANVTNARDSAKLICTKGF